jgi:hypothetical protein
MGARSEPGPGLAHRISAADRAGLIALVTESSALFTEREALQCLRHPFSSPQVAEAIATVRALRSSASIRKAIALHPGSPRTDALRCLDDLGWRDLLDVGREVRTPAQVRRAANQKVLEKLPRLSAGERRTLARLADRDLLHVLLTDSDSGVFAALLRNPRLVVEDVVAFASTGAPMPEHLALLASDPAWSERPPLRRALLRSVRTPRSSAVSLLAHASQGELRDLTDDPSVGRFVAACASRLLEGGVQSVDRPQRGVQSTMIRRVGPVR